MASTLVPCVLLLCTLLFTVVFTKTKQSLTCPSCGHADPQDITTNTYSKPVGVARQHLHRTISTVEFSPSGGKYEYPINTTRYAVSMSQVRLNNGRDLASNTDVAQRSEDVSTRMWTGTPTGGSALGRNASGQRQLRTVRSGSSIQCRVSEPEENITRITHIQRVLTFSEPLCTEASPVLQFNTSRHNPVVLEFKVRRESEFVRKKCSVHIIAPGDAVVSMVLLSMTCNGELKGFVDFMKGLWRSCARHVNPGVDHVSDGSRVIFQFDIYGDGLITVRINVMAVTKPQLGTIHARYLTPTLGYIQNSGIRLNFEASSHHVKTNTWSHQAIPRHHVMLISVAIAGLGSLPPAKACKNRVELYEGSMNKTVWRLCSRYHNLPQSHISYERAVHVHYVCDRYKDRLMRGIGFRLIYTFLHKSNIPVYLTNGKWNCSTSMWLAFHQHFFCDLVIHCAGGEDEKDCPVHTPCGHNGVLRHGKCYSLYKLGMGATWHQANAVCSSLGPGGRLPLVIYGKIRQFITRRLRSDLTVNSGSVLVMGLSTSHAESHFWINAHDVCTKYVCYGFCETDSQVTNEKNDPVKPANQIVLPNATCSQSCFVPFPHVACDQGHTTHAFLAFDQQTRCLRKTASDRMFCSSVRGWNMSVCEGSVTSLPVPFTCRSEAQDVHYTLVCDHRQDCQDNSDEDFCFFPPCDPDVQFPCESRRECQPLHLKCNYQPDCLDGSDENDCQTTNLGPVKQATPPMIIDLEGRGGWPIVTDVKNTTYPYCPHTHYLCPSDGNCLPIFSKCNGVSDCSGKEDERDCESYVCPGLYRCRNRDLCVLPSDLCDGVLHCPQHDDERFCNLTCPHDCTCLGYAFVCRRPFDGRGVHQLRYLDAQDSGMKMEWLEKNVMLIFLNLARCDVVHFTNVTLPNLSILDLSDNKISVIGLAGLNRLKRLKLSGNPLTSVFAAPHSGYIGNLSTLQTLDLSRVAIKTLSLTFLASFSTLETLNMSQSGMETVQKTDEHISLPKTLRELDTRGCDLTEFPSTLFQGVDNLKFVYSDTYKLCCPAVLPGGFMETCYAPVDEISSCDALLRSNFYRACLSVLATFGILGNSVSFIVRFCTKKSNSRSGFGVFVQHLCVSDFLMGVYLVFIGVADRLLLSDYLWKDNDWRHSAACKLAGFISLASCEVSSLIICLITVDRFLVLRFPFSHLHFRSMSAQFASVAAWATGGALAAVPLLPATETWQFYSQTVICVPLPVTRQDFPGRGYAFGVMIVLNFLLFILIAGGQAFIYVSIQASKMSEVETSSKSHDAAIARRLITVAVSDFLCWFPVGLLGMLASSGTPIPGTFNVIMAIFVLPLNSALNPFLYTLNMLQERFQKRKEEKILNMLMHCDSKAQVTSVK